MNRSMLCAAFALLMLPAACSDDSETDPMMEEDPVFCDVAALVADNCTGSSCHGGAQRALDNYDELTASTSTITLAELALQRMKGPSAIMPPSGKLSDAKIDILSDWIDAGYPQGDAGTNCSP